MTEGRSYQALRSNFESALAEAIRIKSEEEGISTSQAFNRVTAEWLGYELEEDEAFVDGAGDFGVDFWFAHTTGFDIFQTKMHELPGDGTINRGRFDNSGVVDLQRIRSFLLDDSGTGLGNSQLQALKGKWDFEISGRRTSQSTDPLTVNLILVVLGDGLTAPAEQEFDALCRSLESPDEVGEVVVQFQAALYTLDTLVDTRWREDNREWRDKSGKKRKTIALTPAGNWIGDGQDVVFYCSAYDLVQAYEDFGYQLFEPNVRAHIKKSKVNAAIEDSVKFRASRHEFRLLNNGITMVCSGYSKPSANRESFGVREPGIVNGLQTVVALHSGYQQLSHSDKADFESNCFVLVRLLQKNSVRDIGRVVLATNTQNPMQARNLVSNRSEQIYYEQLFAEIGWFYERKQGAWDAFCADYTRWRTLPNKRPQHFRVQSGGRPRDKRVDNESLAQTWLSFIGFSLEAANYKKELFDDKWYEFIFLSRLPKHGADYEYQVERAQEDAIREAPDAHLMLLSWLARELARAAAPSPKTNRDSAIERLDLDPTRISKEELDVELAKDLEYTFGQVLGGSSLIFVELLGYVLYQSLSDPRGFVPALLRNGSAASLKDTFDVDAVVDHIYSDQLASDDVLGVIWLAFHHVLEDLLHGTWRDSYRAAPVKSRFLQSRETRKRLANEMDHLDEFLTKRELLRTWASGIRQGEGLYGFVRSSLCQ